MKKVIVITGASSGMGYATAKKLVDEGHIVYGLARRVDKIKETGCSALLLDITNSESIKKL